ncbi:MAG: hypothetical protein COV44_02750 [Deltaproteobacteria bacterium CG11_big_fil_rev_8_21_14_0_20_45_16]|nr:MAG: hypothetical protein COV44_02750 [Deltaproteobacteria bacterium CG11_big_fil_rev_8_21_14_0_20_45_16]
MFLTGGEGIADQRKGCGMKLSYNYFAVAAIAVTAFVSNASAEDDVSNNQTQIDRSQNKSLLGAMGMEDPSLPTSGTTTVIKKADGSSGLDMYYGIEGNYVGQFQDNSAGGDDQAFRSEIYVTLGLDIIERINIEAGFSFQDVLSQASDDDFSGTYSTGLTNVQARDVINKLKVAATLFESQGDGDREVPVFAVSVRGGRYQVDQVGSFIPKQLLMTESVLTPYTLEQQDAVGVAAVYNKEGWGRTQVSIDFHGFDWIGYTTDALKDVEQDGEGSFAINLLHQMVLSGNEIQLKFSYIHNEEGVYYTRALAGEQPGANDTFAAGASWARNFTDLGTLTIAAEGMYMDLETGDSLWGADALASLELQNIPLTPFIDLAVINSEDATAWAATLGAALRIMKGVTVSAGVQFADKDDGSDTQTNFFVGTSLTAPTEQRVSVVTD